MPLMPSSSREKRLLIVLGVLVVLFGGFLVFRATQGGEDTAAPVDPGPTVNVPSSPSPLPSLSPSPEETLPPLGRDPFAPLIAPANPVTPTDTSFTSPSPTATQTSPSPTPTQTSPSPTPTQTSPSPTPIGGGDIIQIEEHTIQIIDIWTVDGVDWVRIWLKNDGDDGAYLDVREGQQFEYVFKVVSVDDPCASFLHGETPFTLCLPS